MSLNKHDRANIEKEAEKRGYSWNSDQTKMINKGGGSVQFSESGKSVKIKETSYNSTSDAKKSSKW